MMSKVFTYNEALDFLVRYRDCVEGFDRRNYRDALSDGREEGCIYEVQAAIGVILDGQNRKEVKTDCLKCKYCFTADEVERQKTRSISMCKLSITGPCNRFEPTENNG